MHELLADKFVEARRKVISAHFSNLNNMQKKAVMTTEGPLLILAGAGSGKTTVLIHRIANLIQFGCGSESDEVPGYLSEQEVENLIAYANGAKVLSTEEAEALCVMKPVKPWNIIAITFTNKAANELKQRLTGILKDKADGVWAMTFHAACCRILRRDIELLGYHSDFTIYDSSDSEKLMKEVIKEMGLDEKSLPAKTVLSAVSDAKDRLEGPDDMISRAKITGNYRIMRAGEAYREYQKRLHTANALDFDDIVMLTVQLLQNYEDVREYYQQKFRYVLIDEYQDTNNLQYLLATLLSGRYENICVVGDDDQSIYRFRGATIENILSFENQYNGTNVIRLEQNYRSTGCILDAANSVISNNKGRKGKTLWTDNGKGEKIVIYEASHENDEGNYIASRIISGKASGNAFRDYAVLYRTNAQSNAVEMAFKRNGVPYRIIGGTRFFDRAEIKDIMAYLQLINNSYDDLRLKRIINNPARGIGNKTLETIERQAAAAGVPMFSVLADVKNYPSLEKAASKLERFALLITNLAHKLESMPLDEFYDLLIEETGYIIALQLKDSDENRSKIENVRELKSSIIAYMETADAPTLRGFLEEVSLFTDIERYDSDADAAVMMTVHSAKGLEFQTVFLVGMEEGLFPGTRVLTDPSELEEERRLCYVAITRARKQLFVSWARQRMLYGRTSYNKKSRFLTEIPDSCVKSDASNSRRVSWSDGFLSKPDVEHTSYRSRISRGRESDSATRSVSTVQGSRLPELSRGDMIHHSAFGDGLVLNIIPMGGDALLEIAFDSVGTKKLMLKTASAHIRKK